ncbi:MAG TPA: VanW family protein [Longimicrobium sp.]|nr:VanW family protein [Longimicrobium sp.]
MRASDVLRRLVRRAVPLELRAGLAHARRARSDRARGIAFAEARGGGEWPVRVELWQRVMPSTVLEAKLANLRLGASLVDRSAVEPGARWSFWHRVGRPGAARGFREGRNIVDGRLVKQVGGGLCQLSSLLYHLALLGGLEVEERHAHSLDIYREEERFTPLGADATVVWGFKDLRLRNPHAAAVSIGCRVEGDRLIGELRSASELPARSVAFVREPASPGRVRVWAVVDGAACAETEYEQRQGLALA